ncbi:Hypothetical protein ORPV_421 [Orpheovirus IHUMI-LCC2]|uniref:Uncharacterized protein n=1 Tax=Orpheovirus IHUMI-LCC2 TaxID=2023057 RepID=A0A2I2L446_9VIRU|nr:Hypothetical protein ORPV_421 [Orpheovirus IHUMI-LCC2]SNW62325.1 Hypothetical protein ORPV_421 [Orpheovirus IHUMI-LCC2]
MKGRMSMYNKLSEVEIADIRESYKIININIIKYIENSNIDDIISKREMNVKYWKEKGSGIKDIYNFVMELCMEFLKGENLDIYTIILQRKDFSSIAYLELNKKYRNDVSKYFNVNDIENITVAVTLNKLLKHNL